jgi:Na+/H+ antiporter NhaD/arsenite permease-like protein
MGLFAAAAGVSAFLDNVTTMLLMGPITISMMKTANGRDPRPMLMAQVRAQDYNILQHLM